jgi:fructose-1,6-bisphosphatase I
MTAHARLEDHLSAWAHGQSDRAAVATTIGALATACAKIAEIVANGDLEGDLAASRGDGGGGDEQKELDVRANDILTEALRAAPVASVASEELDQPVSLNPGAPLVVAVDPLDGSSNIETNVSVGTIFSILPAPAKDADSAEAFLRPGREQLAAGYFIYGPQTNLVLTVGDGVDIFTLERTSGRFLLTKAGVRVPAKAKEFAINASNYRHWDSPVRIWFNDCLAGTEGCRSQDFNMRWIASMVAEAHRILMRGGVYLYPGDTRAGYRSGRLRLVYEGNPIGMVMEQAGAMASTGRARILECVPDSLHARVPLMFGSREEIERLQRYHADPHPLGEQSPLFSRRGLFRK